MNPVLTPLAVCDEKIPVLDAAPSVICPHVSIAGCRIGMTSQSAAQLGKRVCAPAGSEYTTLVRAQYLHVFRTLKTSPMHHTAKWLR